MHMLTTNTKCIKSIFKLKRGFTYIRFWYVFSWTLQVSLTKKYQTLKKLSLPNSYVSMTHSLRNWQTEIVSLISIRMPFSKSNKEGILIQSETFYGIFCIHQILNRFLGVKRYRNKDVNSSLSALLFMTTKRNIHSVKNKKIAYMLRYCNC